MTRPIRRAQQSVTITIRSALEIPRESLDAKAELKLREAFDYANPDHAKKLRMGLWIGSTPRRVQSYEERDGVFFFPRGAARKIKAALLECGLGVNYVDRRLDLPGANFARGPGADPVVLREDQERIVAAAIAAENCLIRAATGAGKTEAIIALIERLGRPALIVVWTTSLVDQWTERVSRRFGWPASRVGRIGAGKKRIAPITIATQQSLRNCVDEIAGEFAIFVGDEVQRWAATTYRYVAARVPARWRIGVSADERRKDRQEHLIHDYFGPVAEEVGRDELIARGALCPVDLVAVPTDFTVSEIERANSEDRGQMIGKMWPHILDRMEMDEERSDLAAGLAAEEIALGRSVLVFTDRVGLARDLRARIARRTGSACGLFVGGPENRAEFDSTKARLESGEIRAAVGTSCIYQGVDIPRLSVGIVATPTAGNRQLLEQQVGRLRRIFPGKDRGTLYYLWDQRLFPSHLQLLRRAYPRQVTVRGE